MANVSQIRNVTIFEVDRECDSLDDGQVSAFAAALTGAVDAADPPVLLLDLRHTTFIGSSFLGVLVRAWKRLRDRQGRMALCHANQMCSEVLHASKLDTIWEVYPTREAALEKMKEPGI
jgi:anti-anti-sigma factor